MNTTTLQAEVRHERGKGSARRLRRSGKVPAVIYGKGLAPTPLAISPKEITKALLTKHRRNVVFTIPVNGKDELAMVRDLSVDPVDGELMHVDFYKVTEDQEISIMVPFKTTGKPAGVVAGGALNVPRKRIPLKTTPANMISEVVVDVTHLNLFDAVTVGEVKIEGGITIDLDPKFNLAIVLQDRKAQALAAEAAAAESAGPAAAAPAAAEAKK